MSGSAVSNPEAAETCDRYDALIRVFLRWVANRRTGGTPPDRRGCDGGSGISVGGGRPLWVPPGDAIFRPGEPLDPNRRWGPACLEQRLVVEGADDASQRSLSFTFRGDRRGVNADTPRCQPRADGFPHHGGVSARSFHGRLADSQRETDGGVSSPFRPNTRFVRVIRRTPLPAA